MYQILLRKFNIRPQEAGFTFLLILSAVFLGGFISTFDVVAHALFFEQWNQSDFSLVYLFGGGGGILFFGIYSLLHKRLSYKFFHFLILTLITLVVLIYLLSYMLQNTEALAFAGLALMFPVNLLLLLSFWRYNRKLLLPEQTKRTFPLIEFGFFLGVVIACLVMFLLLRYFNHQVLPPVAMFFLMGI